MALVTTRRFRLSSLFAADSLFAPCGTARSSRTCPPRAGFWSCTVWSFSAGGGGRLFCSATSPAAGRRSRRALPLGALSGVGLGLSVAAPAGQTECGHERDAAHMRTSDGGLERHIEADLLPAMGASGRTVRASARPTQISAEIADAWTKHVGSQPRPCGFVGPARNRHAPRLLRPASMLRRYFWDFFGPRAEPTAFTSRSTWPSVSSPTASSTASPACVGGRRAPAAYCDAPEPRGSTSSATETRARRTTTSRP